MGESRKGCSITGKGHSKTEKENDVLKQKIWSFLHNVDARGKTFAKECISLVLV